MGMTHNRKDNDGHKFDVPDNLLALFDDLLDRYSRAKRFTDEYYDLESQFCNAFERYMVG